MEWIFFPIQPFVCHPERIAVVAALFFIAYFIVRSKRKSIGLDPKPLLYPSICWTLFVPWEAYCKIQEYNIRVDLLLIYPLLMGATIAGIVKTKQKDKSPNHGLESTSAPPCAAQAMQGRPAAGTPETHPKVR